MVSLFKHILLHPIGIGCYLGLLNQFVQFVLDCSDIVKFIDHSKSLICAPLTILPGAGGITARRAPCPALYDGLKTG
jgi:hypothetical protein